MKRIIAVTFVVILAILATGCEIETLEAADVRQETEYWKAANYAVDHIQYVKDTSTDLCFAYYWGGGNRGGPTLATVPCEAIPPHLLMVPK